MVNNPSKTCSIQALPLCCIKNMRSSHKTASLKSLTFGCHIIMLAGFVGQIGYLPSTFLLNIKDAASGFFSKSCIFLFYFLKNTIFANIKLSKTHPLLPSSRYRQKLEVLLSVLHLNQLTPLSPHPVFRQSPERLRRRRISHTLHAACWKRAG